MDELVVGIDIGTSSTKAVLADREGRVLMTTTRPHSISSPGHGRHEMDAEAIWWGDVVSVCRELMAHPGADRVRSVCVSGVGPCVVPADVDGRPLRAAILYGIDTRAAAQVARLNEELEPSALLSRAGKLLSTQAAGPKLAWLREEEPEVWARTQRWYGCSSYVVARLTGEYVQDHQTASQCDPLYDLRQGDWAQDWVERVVGDLPMPRLVWPGDPVGEVTPAAREVTGLPAGTVVVAGTVDAWAEAFSCGVRRPGDRMLMYGSTMFSIQVLDKTHTHPRLWTTAGVERGRLTLAAGMATSGSLVEWMRELTGGEPIERLLAEAADVPPGADGVVVLPYFAGERAPIDDPRARGLVAGLSLRHTRAHLIRATFEGIAFGVRQILELFDDVAGAAGPPVAVGGGTQVSLWTRVVSDVSGVSQLLPQQRIGASYGSALLAATGAGMVPQHTDWASIATTVEPDERTAATYDELYARYLDLYESTKPTMHVLAEMQERSSDTLTGSRST